MRSLDLVVGTGVPPVSGWTSQGTTVAHVVARPVWETPFVANPGVIWGVPLGVAAAEVWVVVVSDAVPVVVVTTGKITRRRNRLIGLGVVTPLSEIGGFQGSAEVGAAAIWVSERVGGAKLAFAFPELTERFQGLTVNKFGRTRHLARGDQPQGKKVNRRRSPQRSTDGRTSEDWRGQTKDRGDLTRGKVRDGVGQGGGLGVRRCRVGRPG